MMKHNRKGLLVAVGILQLFLLGGCAQNYEAGIYPVPSALISSQLDGGGTVALENSAEEGKVLLGGPDVAGFTYWGDLQQITDTVVFALSSELRSRGFRVEENAPVRLDIKLDRVQIVQEARTQCELSLQLHAGDCDEHRYCVQNSGFGYPKACDGAIAKAVVIILNDPKVIEYLTE
jgi:uncharacterized lipoprotein YajG